MPSSEPRVSPSLGAVHSAVTSSALSPDPSLVNLEPSEVRSVVNSPEPSMSPSSAIHNSSSSRDPSAEPRPRPSIHSEPSEVSSAVSSPEHSLSSSSDAPNPVPNYIQSNEPSPRTSTSWEPRAARSVVPIPAPSLLSSIRTVPSYVTSHAPSVKPSPRPISLEPSKFQSVMFCQRPSM